MSRIYLANHGDYLGQNLTQVGIDQMRNTAETLHTEGMIGSSALILASIMPRTVESAEIIQQKTGAELVKSKAVAIVGNNRDFFKSMRNLWERVSEADGYEVPVGKRDILVVTHMPMMRLVKSIQEKTPNLDDVTIKRGEVFECTLPEDWENPNYKERLANLTFRPDMINRFLR